MQSASCGKWLYCWRVWGYSLWTGWKILYVTFMSCFFLSLFAVICLLCRIISGKFRFIRVRSFIWTLWQLQMFLVQRNMTDHVTCGLCVSLCISCKSISMMYFNNLSMFILQWCMIGLSKSFLLLVMWSFLSQACISVLHTDFVDILSSSHKMVWQYSQEWKDWSWMDNMSSLTQSVKHPIPIELGVLLNCKFVR